MTKVQQFNGSIFYPDNELSAYDTMKTIFKIQKVSDVPIVNHDHISQYTRQVDPKKGSMIKSFDDVSLLWSKHSIKQIITNTNQTLKNIYRQFKYTISLSISLNNLICLRLHRKWFIKKYISCKRNNGNKIKGEKNKQKTAELKNKKLCLSKDSFTFHSRIWICRRRECTK